MTTTVGDLRENLKDYPETAEVYIRDIDDLEFAIVDFNLSENNVLSVIIREKSEDELEEEES